MCFYKYLPYGYIHDNKKASQKTGNGCCISLEKTLFYT